MRSDIHMEILRRAINEMIDYHGYTANSITMESGVHNITRYLNKGMTITPENLLKLHKTFPDYIPEPVYKSDKKIYQHVSSALKKDAINSLGTIGKSPSKAKIIRLRSSG